MKIIYLILTLMLAVPNNSLFEFKTAEEMMKRRNTNGWKSVCQSRIFNRLFAVASIRNTEL